jgi:hypothetical protein
MAVKWYNFWQAVIVVTIVALGELHTFWEKSTVAGKWIYVYPWKDPIRLQNYIYDNARQASNLVFILGAKIIDYLEGN